MDIIKADLVRWLKDIAPSMLSNTCCWICAQKVVHDRKTDCDMIVKLEPSLVEDGTRVAWIYWDWP